MPADRRVPLTFSASVETVVLAASVFWALTANRLFFAGALDGSPGGPLARAGFALALGAALVALHFLLVAPWSTRWTTKPLLALLLVVTACATFYMERYSVYLDPSMLRNVMRTDVQEARELVTPALVLHLAVYAGLPLLVLSRVRLVARRGWVRALAVRAGALLLALAALVAAVVAIYQPLASLMRNQRELRYLITPGNYVWSLASVAGLDARAASGPRRAIGLDAAPGPRMAARTRPTIVVLVVGETARAANWGLDGYARNTTPELAALPVIDYPDVTACGTSTEVSLPCMFAPVGRRSYDEDAIRGSESLLQVVARAGVAVRWRDNQSGCKGVCEGIPTETVEALNPPGLCAQGRCLDEGLLAGLDALLDRVRGTELLVLHQLGNHGPAYFRRYPPEYARFRPACASDDLRRCSSAEIVNAYDNALLYTDHVLAALVRTLQAHAGNVDSALIYVSDHGESLGEGNLYLHGLPYAIAPAVQKKVPMVLWLSDGFAAAAGIDVDCLRRNAARPASHDNLFHTLLGLLDVRTALHAPGWDLTRPCTRSPVA